MGRQYDEKTKSDWRELSAEIVRLCLILPGAALGAVLLFIRLLKRRQSREQSQSVTGVEGASRVFVFSPAGTPIIIGAYG